MSEETTAVDTTETAEPSIDMAAAVEKISADLFPDTVENEATPTEAVATAITETPGPPTKTVPPLPTIRQAPKSWAKDVHPIWEKIDPKGQEYIEKRERDFLDGLEQYKGAAQFARSVQDVLTPYQPLLQQRGLDAPAVIRDLMQTYTALTQGTPEQRQQAWRQVAENLKIPMPGNGSEPVAQVDPRIQALEQQFQQVQQALTMQQQSALQAATEKATSDVTAFADDPAHAHFDECFEEIIKFIKAGDSLQEAYDKAVWANPVTREKHKQAWFQTETEKARERARLDALPKQKARSVNVKQSDTQRPPTEPLGSMEDTLRSTLKSIKEKTVH